MTIHDPDSHILCNQAVSLTCCFVFRRRRRLTIHADSRVPLLHQDRRKSLPPQSTIVTSSGSSEVEMAPNMSALLHDLSQSSHSTIFTNGRCGNTHMSPFCLFKAAQTYSNNLFYSCGEHRCHIDVIPMKKLIFSFSFL